MQLLHIGVLSTKSIYNKFKVVSVPTHLHGNEPVEHNQFDIVVTLLNDEVNVAAGSGLHGRWGSRQCDL